MSLEDDDIIFNESKARELIYILLKNDIIIYKKLIPEIKKLNSEAFENMFKGVPFKKNDANEEGYYYPVKNKKEFEKLLNKIDNFAIIMEQWYQDENYYEYLKELWIKYISIEELRNKNEKKIEEILESNSIHYRDWPQNIKEELKSLIQSTENTRIFEMKDILNDQFAQINNILEDLINFKNQIKDQGKEGKIYEANAIMIITQLIGTVMMPIASAIKYGNEAIADKEIRAATKLIMQKCDCDMQRSSELVNEIMTKSQSDKEVCNWGIKNMKTNEFYKDCNIKATEGKIENLSINKKAKTFLKCKAVCAIHCALSFLNLGWSIYELTQTYKGFEQVKIYEKRLKQIVTIFNIHKNEIGILPSDFREASERIRNVLEKIKKDEQDLEDLITDILKSINEQDSRKNRSALGLGLSGALGVVGIAGALLTSNGTALTYGISSIANLLSAIGHSTNILWSIKIIEGYRKVLKEAREEKKKMEDEMNKIQVEIDRLIKEMTSKIEEQPKFELSASLSSISTID